MRSGACTVQQTLTAEAASVLKHSLSLARRRGHAQVTPLHVAATLLSSRASVLRRACLKSQPHHSSHPLQCRALELCFNVALNRLPTTPGPLLHSQPSLSNALIAALKRAQAHQRRGCIEQQQQQPLLTIKVELEQLIISILDDPSVSRVMREAGFSSTAVKNNIDDSSSSPSSVFQCYTTSGGGVFSSPCSPSPSPSPTDHGLNPTAFWGQNPLLFSPQKKVAASKEDVKLVLEVLLRKKRNNTVIVGDCVATNEGLVSELTARIERGDVPDEIKHVHFIKFNFAPVSLRFMKREDVENHVADLKRRVDSIAMGSGEGGVIIYAGDLRWTAEETLIPGYSPVDHLVTEIGRLLSQYNNNNLSNAKVRLVATASYQTYLRCQMRQPPLEAQWGLQPVSVPSGGLGLTLHASSVYDSRMTVAQNSSQALEMKPFANKDEHDHKLTCCAECTSNYEKDVQLFKSGQQKMLPPWLQPHGSNNAGQKDELLELRRKWNRLCHSLHQSRHNQNHLRSTMYNNQTYPYASAYPWWPCQSSILPDSTSISFSDTAGTKPNHSPNSVPKFRRQNSCTIEFNFSNDTHKHQSREPNLDSLKNSEDKEVKITLALGNSLFSSSGKPEKDQTNENIHELLQANVPWQSEAIASIAETLTKDSNSTKKETWLLIQGNDLIGKRRLARAIAESVLGSADSLLHMNMRNNEATPHSETLLKATGRSERVVVLIENVDLADTQFLKLLANGFKTGFGDSISRAIFILTKSTTPSSHQNSVIDMRLSIAIKETETSASSPNSGNKRKPEWDIVSNTLKAPKTTDENTHFTTTTLDLNMKLTDDDDNNDNGETGFLSLIPNRYVFERNAAGDKAVEEVLMAKMKGIMKEAIGSEREIRFSIEDKVLEGILIGFENNNNNGLFDKWLKDIFQTGLERVKVKVVGEGEIAGKRGIVEIKLSYGGIVEGDGYMGTCLPKNMQLLSSSSS